MKAVAGAALGTTNVSLISEEKTDSRRPSFTPVARNPTVLATRGFWKRGYVIIK
jgi:hypothetical protein